MRKGQKNPKAWVLTMVASTAVAAAVALYGMYINSQEESATSESTRNEKPTSQAKKSQKTPHKYTNRSIALTLLHSILSLTLPLNEILINSENVTFILPPNLSLDDLQFNIDRDLEESNNTALQKAAPKKLLKNYKLLNCLNMQGYFNIVKNLRPDVLLLCGDDLGIQSSILSDFDKFVKETVNLTSDRDVIYESVYPMFVR